ncbi:uncharacterized protein ACMZJ9_012406 [Mantella aurantiaca]
MEQPAVTMLITALCLMCMAGVWADNCAPYVDPYFTLHPSQSCIMHCTGTCTNRRCTLMFESELDQTQLLCILNNLYMVIGLGITIGLLLIASIISCICKCMFVCYRAQHII